VFQFLSRFFEQFASDQHAADFGRAGADFIKLGVARQLPGRSDEKRRCVTA